MYIKFQDVYIAPLKHEKNKLKGYTVSKLVPLASVCCSSNSCSNCYIIFVKSCYISG